MLAYTLKDSTRRKMATEPRAVQIAISTIANQSFAGQKIPAGIGKYEGGVKVNNREIAIHYNNVMDDWARCIQATPEEIATVRAITEVARMIEAIGLNMVRAYDDPNLHMADPLRSMLAATDNKPKLTPWQKRFLSP